MDIRTMPAGQELDKELSKAIGWWRDEYIENDTLPVVFDDDNGGLIIFLEDKAVGSFDIPFSPSTTWDGAGQVIEEMRRRGWWIKLEQSGWFGCSFEHAEKGMRPATEFRPDAPAAITVAAILAIRSEAEHA